MGAPSERRRAVASGVVGAVVSQAIVASSSLALQVVAARSLSAEGLGSFALLTSVVIVAAALANGWIGDSIVVLDRFDPEVRGALVASLLVWVAGGAVLAGVVGGVAAGVGLATALALAGATALWLVEETARRLFLARRELWAMAVNDGAYAVVAVGGAIALAAAGGATLSRLIGVMAAGAAAAIAVAAVQLPRAELRATRPRTAGLRRLARFAAWRTGHVAIRPAAQFGARVVIVAVASTAVLGSLEIGRLVLAPVATVLPNAAGAYLLSSYAAAARDGRRPPVRVGAATAALLGVSAVYVAAIWPILDRLTELLTDGDFGTSRAAVLSWALVMAGTACSIPSGSALAAHERVRELFVIRLVGTLVGLGATAAIAAADPNWAPLGLALGELLQAVALQRRVRTLDWQGGGRPQPDASRAVDRSTASS